MIVAIVNFSGCSTKLKTLQSSQSSNLELTELSNANIVINNAAPGCAPNGHFYDKSGIYLSNCIKDMIVILNKNTKLSNKTLSLDEMVKYVAKNNNAKYLIYASILNWEDHVTEWTGVPDRITIDLKLVKIPYGTVVAHEEFMSSSKWATLGGDHPQDLLAKPFSDIFQKWFGKSGVLNPTHFTCEKPTLQADYD